VVIQYSFADLVSACKQGICSTDSHALRHPFTESYLLQDFTDLCLAVMSSRGEGGEHYLLENFCREFVLQKNYFGEI